MATRINQHSRVKRAENQSLRLRLSEYGPLAIVAMMGIVVPLSGGPQPALPWDGASGVAFQLGAFLLLAVALWQAEWPEGIGRILRFARRGPQPWMLGLLLWGLASWVLSCGTKATLQGVLQLVSGLVVYAAVSSRTRRSGEYKLLLDALAVTTIIVSLFGSVEDVTAGSLAFGGLFNHRLFGAFLMLTVPLLLVYSWACTQPWRRLMAQGAVGFGLVGLLAAHWMPVLRGGVLALVLVGLLCWRFGLLPHRKAPSSPQTDSARRRSSSRSHRSRRGRDGALSLTWDRRLIGQGVLYGVIAFASLGVFLALTPRGVSLLRQTRPALAATTTHTSHLLRHISSYSFTSGGSRGEEIGRQSRGALLAMVKARPLLGWGIGSFAVYQKTFTQQGDESGIVSRTGPQMIDRPQSLYLPLAAELGVPGLALWGGMLAAFFLVGIRALSRTGVDLLRRRILVGCLAAVAGQVVDAFTDGAWQFGALSLFLWTLLGLGMAAAGLNIDSAEEEQEGAAATAAAPRGKAVTPIRVAGLCLISAVFLALIMRVVG